jgi:hypothetical protein
MGFVVRAVLTEHGGTYTAEFETLPTAITSAVELRVRGFRVTITGTDGKLVDETQDE